MSSQAFQGFSCDTLLKADDGTLLEAYLKTDYSVACRYRGGVLMASDPTIAATVVGLARGRRALVAVKATHAKPVAEQTAGQTNATTVGRAVEWIPERAAIARVAIGLRLKRQCGQGRTGDDSTDEGAERAATEEGETRGR